MGNREESNHGKRKKGKLNIEWKGLLHLWRKKVLRTKFYSILRLFLFLIPWEIRRHFFNHENHIFPSTSLFRIFFPLSSFSLFLFISSFLSPSLSLFPIYVNERKRTASNLIRKGAAQKLWFVSSLLYNSRTNVVRKWHFLNSVTWT